MWGRQNFLICIEMALAAAVHHFVFSRREFKTGLMPKVPGGGRLTMQQAFREVLPSDVVREAGAVGVEVAGTLHRTAGVAVAAAASAVGGGGSGVGGGDPWQYRGSASGGGVGTGGTPEEWATTPT